LYESFINGPDKQTMRAVRAAQPEALEEFIDAFQDERLKSLLPLYKARNYPRSLSPDEQLAWDQYCQQQLLAGGTDSRLAKFFARLAELAAANPTGDKQYLLEELQLYGQSIMPADAAV
jgi:exodeoxyribonuclease-1